MSISATNKQTNDFLTPLRGNLTILLLRNLQARLRLSRFMLKCASLQSMNTAVLDTNAFYCTNIEKLTDDDAILPSSNRLMLIPPERDFEVMSLVPLLSSSSSMVIIDDLNSLYSLASDSRKLHQLAIFSKLLSFNARMNKFWVIATAYNPRPGARHDDASRRSPTTLADLLVDADLQGNRLLLKAGFKCSWPNGELKV